MELLQQNEDNVNAYGIISRPVFKFDDLSESAKETAIRDYAESLTYDWWNYVYEDVKTIGALMGIEIDDIYFHGFWSQGDGACFEGSYRYKKGSVKAVKAHAPLDSDLHQIVVDLSKIQRPAFYGLSATITHSGNYSHEYYTDIKVYDENSEWGETSTEDQEDGIIEALRDFMRWIYSQLEKEYTWLTSEENVKEMSEINVWLYDENGEIVF